MLLRSEVDTSLGNCLGNYVSKKKFNIEAASDTKNMVFSIRTYIPPNSRCKIYETNDKDVLYVTRSNKDCDFFILRESLDELFKKGY